MPDARTEVLEDLRAEGDVLEALVSHLDPTEWQLPTPAEGWDVAHQVAHLTWTDQVATAAATDKQAWDAAVERAMADPDGFVDAEAARLAALPPTELLERWRTARAALARALTAMAEGEKLPWFGPPMSPASMATARLMETWAHGLDVAEALGVEVAPTNRLRHIARLGTRTRDYSFLQRGLTPPSEEFRVELTGPDGDTWAFGPSDAPQKVSGPAYDFCLLVTRRRHPDDLRLVARGLDARRWLGIAQAFAGPAGADRAPRAEVAR